MIEVRDLRYRYPRQDQPALRDVSLSVGRGVIFGLLGPNGSGKTTLISILTGVRSSPQGAILVDGLDVRTRTRDIQRFCAFVPQENSFYPTLTVAENLDFFASVQGIAPRDRAGRIDKAVAIGGLERVMHQRAAMLSGGLKRRTSVAIGLLNNPRLLFLDEPTVGIDPQSRHFLLEAIQQINASGTTVVYSSHYMEEVEAICHEVAILDAGRVLVQGPLGVLLRAHGHRLRVDVTTSLTEEQRAVIERVPGARHDKTRIEVDACSPAELSGFLETLRSADIAIATLEYGVSGLEDVFLTLTKPAVRDD